MMKKKYLKPIIISAIVLVLAGVPYVACSSGCSISSVVYDNAELYTAGSRTIKEKVAKLEIDWINDDVIINTHDSDTIDINEDTQESDEDKQVHTWVDGTTLRIKYCKSGKGDIFAGASKTLHVTIPRTIELEEIVFNSASANVSAEGLKAERIQMQTASGNIALSKIDKCSIMRLNTVSGDITVDSCSNVDSTDIGTISGDINCKADGENGKIKINSTSGSIKAEAEQADVIDLSTVSGEKSVSLGTVNSLVLNSTSGDNMVTVNKVPLECQVSSVSGDTEFTLPLDADLTLEYSTVSGDFNSNMYIKKQDDKYICGKGTASFIIKTTSGDVRMDIDPWNN